MLIYMYYEKKYGITEKLWYYRKKTLRYYGKKTMKLYQKLWNFDLL